MICCHGRWNDITHWVAQPMPAHIRDGTEFSNKSPCKTDSGLQKGMETFRGQ